MANAKKPFIKKLPEELIESEENKNNQIDRMFGYTSAVVYSELNTS